jgi:DNA-binding protein
MNMGVGIMAETFEKDIVYIGSKPQMSYVLAVITQFNEGHASEVTLKARGRAISRTVDVAEIVKNKFIPDVKIEDIRTSTEAITRDDGSTSNVSAIEITLRR